MDAYLKAPLDALFQPRSIAAIGASRDPDSMSGRLFCNLVESFGGPLYPVNPHVQRIGGRPAYASVLDVPGPIDLAFIAIPAVGVLNAARQCAQKGVKCLVVISAGFSETDFAGGRLEADLLQIAKSSGMRLAGPNSFGVCSTASDRGFNGTFSPLSPPPGEVAVCTQSGALGVVFPDYARTWNLGISSFVSMGNKADLAEEDLLPWWEEDPTTKVIALYLESIRAPRELLSVARRAARRKPIVVLKAGRTPAGTRAAASHTSALASPTAAADALFRQAGFLPVRDLQQWFETIAFLATQPLPSGRRVGIVTNAGGPAVLCADALESRGMLVPEFSPSLQQTLHARIGRPVAVRNPIDLLASVEPSEFEVCLQSLIDSGEVDALITIYVPRLSGTSQEIADAIKRIANANAQTIPLLAVMMQAIGTQLDSQAPVFQYPESAAHALANANGYAEWLRKTEGREATFTDVAPAAARRIVERSLTDLGESGGWQSPDEAQSLLGSYGIAVPKWTIADSPESAVVAALQIGGPVVLKAMAPGLIHKSAVGGVELDLRSQDEVRAAMARLVAAVPSCKRVLVQEFVRGGTEILIGVTCDPVFGHLIGFGAGGTAVESLRDVAFRLHPLTDRDADDLLEETRVFHTIKQHAKDPMAMAIGLRNLLLRVSALISVAPEIAEMDLNPINVSIANGVLSTVDVRIRLANTQSD